ncbi:MAG: spermidine/putrescine ABC transporter substrate-binding protein [Anaerolineae bacterium]|jgi:spermidine/putrescine transport system substrate-binding protein
MTRNTRRIGLFTLFLLFVILLPACGTPTPAPVEPLIYRDWEGVMPQAVLDAFTAETGIPVTYVPYEIQEDAVAEMRAGQAYDVVVLENQLIPPLVADGLLAEIDYSQVPNFKNISANFRDLAYDPQNAHSVPYSWGTTGLVVRTDLTPEPVTRWADLWDARYAGRVMGWTLPRYMVGLTLKSLGYSLNSEDPAELEEALDRLVALKPGLTLLEWEPAVAAPYLISGEAVVAVGQADDVLVGREENPAIAYILPREGGLLWGDNWTIPSNAPNKDGAEKLIDFLLRPESAAQIINETYYWLPNDAALPLVDEELRNNEAIFPSDEALQNAEILLPLSPEGEALHQEIWQRFLEAGQ